METSNLKETKQIKLNIISENISEEDEEMLKLAAVDILAEHISGLSGYDNSEEQDIEIDELDTDQFDDMIVEYLQRVYENVSGYITEAGTVSDTDIVLEGIITTKTGIKKPTKFVFEALGIDSRDRLIFEGKNEIMKTGDKGLRLISEVFDKKVLPISLSYNYQIPSKALTEGIKIKGEVFAKRALTESKDPAYLDITKQKIQKALKQLAQLVGTSEANVSPADINYDNDKVVIQWKDSCKATNKQLTAAFGKDFEIITNNRKNSLVIKNK